jgi:hypothetical protein
LPLLLAAGDVLFWYGATFAAFPGGIVALIGYQRLGGWMSGPLEPYCLGRTSDAYRDATRHVVFALVAFVVAAFVPRSAGLYLGVLGATAIISFRLLSRHVATASIVLHELDEATVSEAAGSSCDVT